MGEWLDRWLAAHTGRPNTLAIYRQHCTQRLKPSFGATKLGKLTAWDIEAAAGRWEGEPATVRGALSVLGTAMKAAVRAELLDRSPVTLARRPPAAEQKFDLFARAELRQVFDAGLSRPEWHAFAILAGTGCRIGEAMGLRPTDYDAGKGTLRIERQLTRNGIGEPKSRRSKRTIEVPSELAPALTATAETVTYTSMVKRWNRFLTGLGLRGRGMHQVRHSVATYLLADGFPVADLAAHLGHSVGELLKTYGHPTGASAGAAARRLLGL